MTLGGQSERAVGDPTLLEDRDFLMREMKEQQRSSIGSLGIVSGCRHTRNPKLETRIPKSETRTRSPKHETRSPKHGTRKLKPETGNPKPETRDPKPKS